MTSPMHEAETNKPIDADRAPVLRAVTQQTMGEVGQERTDE